MLATYQLFNLSEIIKCAICIIVFITVGYIIWKKQFGKKVVNCWFCNTNSIVAAHSANCWTCQHCHQYNGFTSTGDYNEKIPQMHDETMNIGRIAQDVNEGNSFIQQRAKLCSKCTRNQLLKVKQLSQFEPIDEENFEYEVAEFKKNLEKLYSLCSYCEKASKLHINMQDSIILRNMKMLKQPLKNENISVTKASQSFGTKHCKKRIACGFWFIVAILSVLFMWFETCKMFNNIDIFCKVDFWDVSNNKDVLGLIMISGCVISWAALSLDGISQSKVSKLCGLLWLFCVSRTLLVSSIQVPSLMWLTNYVPIFSPLVNDVKTNILPINVLRITSLNFVIVLFRLALSFTLIGTSFFNFYFMCTANAKTTPFHSKKSFYKDLRKQHIPQVSSNPDAGIYSDSSMPSDDETKPTEINSEYFDNKTFKHSSCISSSLNALNLQDNTEENFEQFKRPGTFLSSNFSSALHTPPPSRSSSLLSLSSHQSFSSSNAIESNKSISKFGSTADFATSSRTMPIQQYKANTIIGGWTLNQANNFSKFSATGSTASFPLQRKKLSHLNNSFNIVSQQNIDKDNKPLISPARLRLRYREHLMKDTLRNEWFESNSYDSAEHVWEQKFDPDVSIHDSVSQVGEQNFPELSDDEMFKSPQYRPKKSNVNSSPGSSISHFTSASVERLENSRLCRWILALCIFVNVFMLILLAKDVKEMREMEQWKSRAQTL